MTLEIVQCKAYGFWGVRAEVYTTQSTLTHYPSYPWRFRLRLPDGHAIHYAGTPNYCGSLKAAVMRAWWRAKWLADGSHFAKYKD
jgi:hypothetical protein